MASKDLPKGKMVPKTNTSSSSSVPPRKYGAHSGLKFKFNLGKDSISKSTIGVESRTEKRLPPRKLYAQIEPKVTLNLESNAITNSNILESQKRKEKQPPHEDGHLVLKLKLQRDSKRNSASSESKIEKEKPLSAEDGHSGLKIKLERDSKKSTILERKTNKEKPPLPEDGRVGLKTNLEKNAKEKSATTQSKIEKEKPPRKYGAHSGLKFKFNTEKCVIPKTFIIESSTADTKRYSDAKKIGTVMMETFETQTHKVHHNPDVEKYASTMKEREKTLRESESFYDVIVEENVQDDIEILSKKEFAKFYRNSVASFRDLKHHHKSPKVTKFHAGGPLKPPEIASTASNLSSLNVPQISKGRTTITKEPPIPRYSHAMTVRTITRQIVESEADKEERHKSGVRNYASTFEENEESSKSESFYEVIVDENVQDGCEILSKKEIAFLCSTSVASFRDLKNQHKGPKITNSRACSTLKPPEIASEASNLPSLNVLQTSKGRIPVAKDPPVPRYSDATRFVNIAKPVGENQIHKEERHKSGVNKYETNLQKDEKTLDESEFIYDVVVDENMQDDFEILPKKEMAKLRSKSIASSRDLKHQHTSSKITNSLAYDALKPSEIAPKASNFSSLNVPQISKGCPTVSKESKCYETRYSDATKFVNIAKPVGENQIHKEERHKSGVKKYETNLEEDENTLDENEFYYDVVVDENMQDDFEILPKKEMAKLRSNSIASSRDLKHQHKSSKITNSLAYDALKPSEIASKASNFSSWNDPEISKGYTPVSKESKVYETSLSDDPRPCTIAMKVAENQTLKEERHKSGVKKYESDLEEEDVQILPGIESLYQVIVENVQDYYEVKPLDTTSVGAVTTEIDDFAPIKKSDKSGKGKPFSTQKDDYKLGGQSGHNSISMNTNTNSIPIQDTKMSIKNESEDLCSRVATSLRVLQPQLRALKISKSQVSDASKPQAIVCKTSKLPMLNIQKSRGLPTKLEEPMTPASPRKYGFHAGLRFSFKEKKVIPVDINFNRTPSVPKDKCFKNEKRDPAS